MIIANLKNIKIVMGLGNFGKEYEKTRHNAGFLFIDYLAAIRDLRPHTRNFVSVRGRFAICGSFQYAKIDNLVLAKPLIFMNESGAAAKAAIRYFKVKPEEILIIHDDSDIETGKYKMSFNRGAAGHRGVESIIKSLKTKGFWRLRIGIRPKTRNNADIYTDKRGPQSLINADQNADKRGYIRENLCGNPRESAVRAKAGEFVLKNFSKEESENLKKLAGDINSFLPGY